MKKYRYCRERDGIVHLDVTVDGKRIRRSTGRPATKDNLNFVERNWQAEVKRILAKEEIAQNAEANEKGITVKEYGYRSLKVNRAFRKENTTYEYTLTFEQHVLETWGDIPIQDIVQSDLKDWIADLADKGLSGKRIHNIRMVFQGILKDAVGDGIIEKNPFDGLKGLSRKTKKEIQPFTLDEARLLIAHGEGWFRNLLAVAFFTGMRSGELLALRWEDVNLVSDKIVVRASVRRNKITDTKTGAVRMIDMLPPVKQALKEQFKETGLSGGFVFPARSGKGYAGTASIRKYYWLPLLKRLKLPARDFYNTRHTFASIMISKGEDILWVSKMLGHSQTSMTLDVYSKFREDEKVKRAKFLDEIEELKSNDVARDCHVSVTREKKEQTLKLA